MPRPNNPELAKKIATARADLIARRVAEGKSGPPTRDREKDEQGGFHFTAGRKRAQGLLKGTPREARPFKWEEDGTRGVCSDVGAGTRTDEERERRVEQWARANNRLGEKSLALGGSFSTLKNASRDGSQGGGPHTHGGLSDATKDSPVVIAMRKLHAPPDADAETVFRARVAASRLLLGSLVGTGEVYASVDELRAAHPPSTKGDAARAELEEAMQETTDPASEAVSLDVEGFTPRHDPLGGLTQLGVGKGSFGRTTEPEVVVDERGGRSSEGLRGKLALGADARRAGALRLKQAFDDGQDSRGAKRAKGAKRVKAYHHAGKDHLVVAALGEELDVSVPEMVNLHGAISVGLGRRCNGKRRCGFSSDDGLGMGMEALAHMLGFEFVHSGADDACKQLVAWRPLLVALREHYYGY